MATIEIRDVPDDGYDTLVEHARATGRSVEDHVRDHLCRLARPGTAVEPHEADLHEEIRRHVTAHGTDVDRPTLLSDKDADRR